jgi:hypothetical protein
MTAVMRRAIEQLNQKSHDGPVTDEYGYNHFDAGTLPMAVRDLMFEGELEVQSESGDFVVEMKDGRQVFDVMVDAERNEVRLYVDGNSTPVRQATLLEPVVGRSLRLEVSMFDRQICVAIDGEEAFEPLALADGKLDKVAVPRRPVRFGGRGIDADLHSILLYRDVHYTPGKARNGVNEPCRLSENEYFVLGDNSPVSADSRNWSHAGVPAHLLLGQPFVVHLPSRPGRIRIGSIAKHIRIPDFERMRYIQ